MKDSDQKLVDAIRGGDSAAFETLYKIYMQRIHNFALRKLGVAARQALACVQQAIEALPREQRRMLELRHGKRLAIRRIAELTHRSEDAVKSSLYRARRTLASKLPGAKLELSF